MSKIEEKVISVEDFISTWKQANDDEFSFLGAGIYRSVPNGEIYLDFKDHYGNTFARLWPEDEVKANAAIEELKKELKKEQEITPTVSYN